ncbi:MAG: gfo/Idh/MocA family oxidoreductase, partial [Candidatus Aminicenantes bacterium]|nr:gfo/Idh/MocA family oxidoreductase [Candidatus Aminicenantes bacterium]
HASDPSILQEKIGDNEIHLYKSSNHMKNFLECMRSRQDPITPVEIGHHSNSVCVITHIAMKLGKKLRWDPDNEKFINDEGANKWLDFPHRAPWIV